MFFGWKFKETFRVRTYTNGKGLVQDYIVHNNFFLSYSMFACAMYWFFVISFFFNFRIIGSAEALPILCVRYFRWERERERERDTDRDGSDVTIVALKLAMSSHFPLPKIRTSRFSLHTSRLSLHGEVYHCGAEHRNEFTLSIAKKFFALFVPPLSNGPSRATSDRKPKTNDQILPSPILFFPSKNWIKLIPKTIGNRKRDCAWGGSGW